MVQPVFCCLLCNAIYPRAPQAWPQADEIGLWWCRLRERASPPPSRLRCGIHQAQSTCLVEDEGSRRLGISRWMFIDYSTAVHHMHSEEEKTTLLWIAWSVHIVFPSSWLPGTLLLRGLSCSGARNFMTNYSPGRKRNASGGAPRTACCMFFSRYCCCCRFDI